MKNRLDRVVFNARLCFYNINGRTYFLLSDHILSWIQTNFDIVFITETHFTKGTCFSLPDFTEYHNPLSDDNDSKPHGGVSCFIRTSVLKFVKKVCKDVSEMIIVELIGGHKIFGCYIVPRDSPYSNESDFVNLANVFSPKNSNRVIIGGGDVNSRVGDLKVKLPAKCSYRKNIDVVVNEYGKLLSSVCQSAKCFVLNNMNIGTLALDGDFTFQKGDRKSQNDLILTNETGLTAVRSLLIHSTIWNPSDHTPIAVNVELDVTENNLAVETSIDILSQPARNDIVKAKKIRPEGIDWDAYKTLVENDHAFYNEKVELLKHDQRLKNLDSVVNVLSESLYKSANTLAPEREQMNEDMLIHDPLIAEAEQTHQQWKQGEKTNLEWNSVRDEVIIHLKKNVAAKERSAWATALSERDPKVLWQKINWKGKMESSAASTKPPLSDLRDHFLKKGQSVEDSTLLSDVTGDAYVPDLDDEISMEELTTATTKHLKDSATGDGWAKKMVVNLPLTILTTLLIIYNTILSAHTYPTLWRTTIVNEIFKNKGESEKASNYRGISLVYMLCKVFDFIMCNRFTKWFRPNDAQTAYQNGKSGADHVFLLRCMTQQAKRLKKKLFLVAVDFDGAFDRISRSLLVRKLIRFGAGTIFVACIASMYMSTDNVIFRDKDYVMYTLYSGIKQGLPLSPILFIFYINDIFDTFRRIHRRCIEDIYKLIHLLIHADDVTLLAVNRDDVIKKLRTLSEYCGLNYIIPQFTKCMFIVVNGSKEDEIPLPFGDSMLKHVGHLEILGSHIDENVSLVDELELHMKKRFKSVIKFFNFCKENKLAPISVKLKALRACVESSLLYNCETFGPKIPRTLESTYHKLIRTALNVRTNTPVLLLYIESGLLPIRALIEARQFKFFIRFQKSLDPDGDRKLVFDELLQDPPNYLQHYLTLHTKYENHHQIYREYIDDVKRKIHENSAKPGGSKFNMYVRINPTLQTSPFISCMHPLSGDIVRFRLGSHNLPIEKGRWRRLNREERVCSHCNVVGDEHHALFECALIFREDLDLSDDMSCIWTHEDVFRLFGRIKETDFL